MYPPLLLSMETRSLYLSLIQSQSIEHCLCKVQTHFFNPKSVHEWTRYDTPLVPYGHSRAGSRGLGVYVSVILDNFLNWEPQETAGSS